MTMQLLSTINSDYATPFMVTVQSTLDHLPDDRAAEWHVLHPGMPERAVDFFPVSGMGLCSDINRTLSTSVLKL